MPKAYKALPPASELWELFDYKPLTGQLVRKRTDRAATAANSAGYVTTFCNGSLYQTHRLVFAWCRGSLESVEIDHIDKNKKNNRIWNLRAATSAQNSKRKGGRGWKKSKNGKKFESRICVNYRYVHLGTFDTEAEARAAYEKASRDLHGEFSSIR